jgi:hypothetical protein
VQTLSIFPQSVIDQAADPVSGIPGKIKYLNLAAIRELLDGWAEEFYERQERIAKASRKPLPMPERNPDMEARINAGFADLTAALKRGFDR